MASLGAVPVRVPTPYGTLAAALTPGGVAVVRRHGLSHRTPPHRVNYRAMADGLRRLGVRTCLATAAVGSVRPEWPAGTLAVVRGFLDLSARRLTLYDREVRHTDVGTGGRAAGLLADAAAASGVAVRDGAVYANLDGPRYETPAEIEALRRLGADLVGMTAGTEAMLFAEAGIAYGCLAVVSNLAAGIAGSVLDHEDVVRAVEAQAGPVATVLGRALEAARE